MSIKLYRKMLFLHGLSYGAAQLVSAGGVFEPTADAFQTKEYFINFHAIYQSTNALSIAVAASVELHIFQYAVLDFKLNRVTARALGSVSVFHWISRFNYKI